MFCNKFQKELPGLDAPPWPGRTRASGSTRTVSAEAWKLWEERMKMILNEYRLMPWQKEAQELVEKHMEDFFFGEGAALPPGYVPQQAKVGSGSPPAHAVEPSDRVSIREAEPAMRLPQRLDGRPARAARAKMNPR